MVSEFVLRIFIEKKVISINVIILIENNFVNLIHNIINETNTLCSCFNKFLFILLILLLYMN